MKLFKKLFAKTAPPVDDIALFWRWFGENEQTFRRCLTNKYNRETIERVFFDPLSEQLAKLREGYFFLAGMKDDGVAELILTADGVVKNLVFVEELVAAAPPIEGWQFTAHKQAEMGISTHMNGYEYSTKTLSFAPKYKRGYPDQVEILVFPSELQNVDLQAFRPGVFIFLDNFIGELDLINLVDHVEVGTCYEGSETPLNLGELSGYLRMRDELQVDSSKDIRPYSDDDEFTSGEARDAEGNRFVVAMNQSLLNWEGKAAYPWMNALTVTFKGRSSDGMPDEATLDWLEKLQEELRMELDRPELFQFVGQVTSINDRVIYFACKDFRASSKEFDRICRRPDRPYSLKYDTFKDKYWLCLESFRQGKKRTIN